MGGDVTATWRETVTLPCKAVGVPEPTRKWHHEGKGVDGVSLPGSVSMYVGCDKQSDVKHFRCAMQASPSMHMR